MSKGKRTLSHKLSFYLLFYTPFSTNSATVTTLILTFSSDLENVLAAHSWTFSVGREL